MLVCKHLSLERPDTDSAWFPLLHVSVCTDSYVMQHAKNLVVKPA